jgi:NADPH:quinone reductase-like Zn-dependent oxidoreductase
MKAIVQDRYGPIDALELRDVDRPTIGPGQVLVRVHASSVHADVWHVVTGRPSILRLMGSGLARPKCPIPGTDLSGVVEEVGAAVTRFQPGDAVFGETLAGMQWKNGGAWAEHAAAPEDGLALKPANVSHEQAASVPTSAFISMQVLRDEGKLRPGHKVLINGAAGGVGAFAVQLAKGLGAAEVVAVDRGDKADMLRSIGADRVLDYRSEDCTALQTRFDLIVDVASNLSLRACRPILAPDGMYVLVGHDHYDEHHRPWLGGVPAALWGIVSSLFSRNLPTPGRFESRQSRLAVLCEQMESGALVPTVDRAYPLGQAVDALRYLVSGDVQGKVVLTPPR